MQTQKTNFHLWFKYGHCMSRFHAYEGLELPLSVGVGGIHLPAMCSGGDRPRYRHRAALATGINMEPDPSSESKRHSSPLTSTGLPFMALSHLLLQAPLCALLVDNNAVTMPLFKSPNTVSVFYNPSP